jgi:hypothetical protein
MLGMERHSQRGCRSMAEIINLNRARKARARAEATALAATNRRKHGRGGAEKTAAAQATARRAALLDGARLEGETDAAAPSKNR